MAIGDYILCCKCDVKLIYDGDRGNREWWQERFGAEPEILCPKCDKREWVGLTDDEIALIRADEREAIIDEWWSIVQADLENGVKSLNEQAAIKWRKEYPSMATFGEWLEARGNT